jgi:hypothetical protein
VSPGIRCTQSSAWGIRGEPRTLYVMMSIFRMRPLTIAATVLLTGLPSALDLWAQTAPPPIVVPQVTPRFNEPGPQLTIPQPGSPVQQSSPVGSQNVPEQSANYRPSRHHAAKHRHVSRTHARHTVAAKKGACYYERCIAQCWASGEQARNLNRKSGSSCPDVCKHRGCA